MKKCFALVVFASLALASQAQSVRLVKDLNPGFADGFDIEGINFGLLANLDSTLIFIAAGKGDSKIICRSDGTDQGTFPLVSPLATNEQFGGYVVSEGLFWFIINRGNKADLYSTDGTLAGTVLRHSQPVGRFLLLRKFAGGVVFQVKALLSNEVLLRRFALPASVSNLGNFFNQRELADLTSVGDSVIFCLGTSADSTKRAHLFRSNGQPGSVLPAVLLDMFPINFTLDPHLTYASGLLHFFYQKGALNSPPTLWLSDGATLQAACTSCQAGFRNTVFDPRTTSVFQGDFFYRGTDFSTNLGEELLVKFNQANPPALPSPNMLKDLAVGPGLSGSPQDFLPHNGRLFFTARNEANQWILWRTDGTPDGTQRVVPQFGDFDKHGMGLTVFHDTLYFGGYTDSTGSEIMYSTGEIGDIHVATKVSSWGDVAFWPTNFRAAGRYLFFTANFGGKGRELCVFDPKGKPVSATQEPDFQRLLKISPNPGGQFCRIELPPSARGKTGQLQVFSAAGQLILEKTTTAATEILGANDWPPGAYLLKFIGEKTAAAGRWVKSGN